MGTTGRVTLLDRTLERIQGRTKALKQATDVLAYIDKLPKELQELCGDADTGYSSCVLHINYWQWENVDVDLLKVAKMAGVTGLAPRMSSPNHWSASGELVIDGDKIVDVNLYALPKPQLCRIEEYEEVQTVKKYKAICAETGEEMT